MKTFYFFLSLLFASNFAFASEAVTIQLETTPKMSEILPDAQMAKLTFRVTQADGSPVDRAQLHIVLDAPKTHPIISTDFPIVEETRLIDIEVEAPQGVFSLDYLLPVRGKYDLMVKAKPVAGFATFQETTAQPKLELNEVPSEVSNMMTFLTILILFGGFSGFILGRHHSKTGEGS